MEMLSCMAWANKKLYPIFDIRSIANGIRCSDGMKVFLYLVWLLFEDSILICACTSQVSGVASMYTNLSAYLSAPYLLAGIPYLTERSTHSSLIVFLLCTAYCST